MAIKTYTEQLEEVQAAITAILTKGASHSAEGRSMTRVDLPALQEREKWLRQQVARDSSGGIPFRAGTPVDG